MITIFAGAQVTDCKFYRITVVLYQPNFLSETALFLFLFLTSSFECYALVALPLRCVPTALYYEFLLHMIKVISNVFSL